MADEKIPDGYMQRSSGVLAPLSLATTQDAPFAWLMTNTEDAETRGSDRMRDTKYELTMKEIETSRRRDPIVFRAVDYYDKLTIGEGIELSSENPAILRAAKAFYTANAFDDVVHQMAIELATTGTLISWMPPLPSDSSPENGFIPEHQLVPTMQLRRIATQNGEPWYYRRKWTDHEYPEPNPEVVNGRVGIFEKPVQKQQDLMAEDVVYTAVNRSAGELRGMSMLEPTIFWSSLYGRSLETVWATAVAKSWIATHIKIEEADDIKLQKLISKIENALVTRVDPRGRKYKTTPTGQVLATGKNVELEPKSVTLSAGSIDSELRRLLLMAAVGTGLPEFALSDGNYANLASSLSQSAPLFRVLQSFQGTLIRHLRRVFKKAFDRYREQGMFATLPPPVDGQHIGDWLLITAPDIVREETMKDALPLLALVQAGMTSKEEASRQMKQDWKQTAKEIEKERESGHAPVPLLVPGAGGGPLPPDTQAAKSAGNAAIETAAVNSALASPVAASVLSAVRHPTPDNIKALRLLLQETDPERHSDINTVEQKHHAELQLALDTYVKELKTAMGDRHEMIKAMGRFVTATRDIRDELMASARAVGQASVVEQELANAS